MNGIAPEHMRIAIADDEELARAHIRRLLAAAGPYEVVADCATGNATIDAVRRERPDLLFLDIQMPGCTGFEVLRELGMEVPPVVVFTTAYDQYALQAFEVSAVDYLLKPITDDRFAETLRRAHLELRRDQMEGRDVRLRRLLQAASGLVSDDESGTESRHSRTQRIAIRNRERVVFVPVADIDWVEAAGDYVKLHVGKQVHLHRVTMHELEQLLGSEHFVRIHRSTIVNAERVVEMQPYFHGEMVLALRDGTKLRMSRGLRTKALSALGIR